MQTTNIQDKKHLISLDDFSLDDIDLILQTATKIRDGVLKPNLSDKIIAQCFFEPSTRTRLSFEAAALRMGASNIGFADKDNTSAHKGESLSDTIKIVSGYADAIVLRHPLAGAARLASEISPVPVINAGDGANRHPTQTLLDLLTISQCHGRLEDIKIAIVGDLKYGRTVHSLVLTGARYNMRFYFVSPKALMLSENLCVALKKAGVVFTFHDELSEIIHQVDVLYMTRMQQERFEDVRDYADAEQNMCLTDGVLEKAQDALTIMHPLPRLAEIPTDMDADPRAMYFQQAQNGLFIRQAILHLLLGQ